MCKSCQYCLETFYWKCCEERFCFDKRIAAYQFDDVDDDSWPHVYNNIGASVESVVTSQPGTNNNHLPQISQLPVHADKIYEVFSKSMIFREEPELSKTESFDNFDDMETKSEPDYLDKPARTVYFEDEIDNPITDFEIMFMDELMRKRMSKIDEEIGLDVAKLKTQNPDSNEVVAKPKLERSMPDLSKSITLKDQNKITTQKPVFQYDPNRVTYSTPNPLIPRNEAVKSILRDNSQKELTRTQSAKSILERAESPAKLKPFNRLENVKPIDTKNMNRFLSKIPNRSASFLDIPDHLLPNKPLQKSKSSSALTTEAQISKLPDTPVVKTGNLPKFFEHSPKVMRKESFKPDTTLASLKEQALAKMKEQEQLGMPRYYGALRVPSPVAVHESKSMPDLREDGGNVVSKRMVKIRSRLKPLVIKKDSNDQY